MEKINLETLKQLLMKHASPRTLAVSVNQYLNNIEPSLDSDYILNQFYVLASNNNNFQLLIDEFNIKTYEQIEKTYMFTVATDELIQPMKYLTKDGRHRWIIRSYNSEYYLKCIEGHKEVIIDELIKHYHYIDINLLMDDILNNDNNDNKDCL